MANTINTIDKIWIGDLFDRQQEAQQLIAYIESVFERRPMREDKKAYTIAVDARYGEGKTFFLKRLAENLSVNHPVAYVDAWADDLADEPLTALAATLKQALGILATDQNVEKQLDTFMQKAGKVAKIATMGLMRRGAALAITATAVEAAAEVMTRFSDEAKGAVADGIKDTNDGIINDASVASRSITPQALMEKRVAEFEQGKSAVAEMKQALDDIVVALKGDEKHPPIVIVIDELDRCRPTYAIKLLEEIKHLFDVSGLVFVLGIHREQLGHSIKGAYGAGFDGYAYANFLSVLRYLYPSSDGHKG